MEPTTNTSKMQNSTLTDVTNHRNSDILILSVLIFSFVLILAASHRGAKAAREEELLARRRDAERSIRADRTARERSIAKKRRDVGLNLKTFSMKSSFSSKLERYINKMGVEFGSVVTVSLPTAPYEESASSISATVDVSATLTEENISVLSRIAEVTNLIIIVCCSEDADGDTATKALRFYGLTTDQVADCRILRSSTTVGRIAIARQINPAIHLDFEEEVVKELDRFKVKGRVYKKGNKGLRDSLETAEQFNSKDG